MKRRVKWAASNENVPSSMSPIVRIHIILHMRKSLIRSFSLNLNIL